MEGDRLLVNKFIYKFKAPERGDVIVSFNGAPIVDSFQVQDRIRQLDPGDTCISADAGRIRQLLHNLIRNAFDALQGVDDARLLVETKPVLATNMLLLVIEDNGPGFDESVIDNVFEPYVTTKQHGTGLGLAIVRKIVEEHHGAITVSNLASGGARGRISFSCMNSAAEAQTSGRLD